MRSDWRSPNSLHIADTLPTINMNYRITKYDPKSRTQEGHFLDNSEWTAISDIGKPEYKSVTYEDYEKTENAYVDSIALILEENNIQNLKVASLELHDSAEDFENYKNDGRLRNIEVDFNNEVAVLKDGSVLSLIDAKKIIRLILRETIRMHLTSSNLKVTFGFDYYMYVDCPELRSQTVNEIESMGLFVEPNTQRRTFIVTDKTGNEL